jgi:ribosomal protein L30/L7E
MAVIELVDSEWDEWVLPYLASTRPSTARRKLGLSFPSWLELRIIQRKSLIGEKPKVVGTMRSLRLRRPNDFTLRPYRPEILGALANVRHLVSVHPSLSPSASYAEPKEVDMSATQYKVDGRKAVRVALANGEYFVAEPHKEMEGDFFASIAWTSDLALSSAIGSLSEVLELFTGKGQVVSGDKMLDVKGRDGDPLTVQETLRLAGTTPDLQFVRLDMPEHSLLWRRIAEKSEPERTEIAVMTANFDRDYFELLLNQTGSGAVRSAEDQLLSQIAYLRRLLKDQPIRTRLGGR